MVRLLVNPAQMKAVQDAEKTGIPLVYLPLHRSHLDYLLITWNSWHFGLRLPHIASGDNLNLSGFGWLLRATGAFFIRRRLDASDENGKDQMYRTVLRSYLEEVLKKNLPIEFFLEGTRSRFGKALLPKNGLISNVVEAVQQGVIGDVYLVPVSYTYDQVAEGVFLQELMGNSKQRESILSVFRGIWKGFGLYQRCGTVRMHYGKPVLLTEYLSSLSSCSAIRSEHRPKQLTRLPYSFSYRELVPWTQSQSAAEFNRALIRSIGFHVVYEAQEICSISPVSIVSTLLLSKYRNDTTFDALANDTQWLAEIVLRDGGDIVGWRRDGTTGNHLLEYALPYMKSSVTREGDKMVSVKTHRQRIQLAYGKNALLHRFSLKAVLAISVISRDPNEVIFFDSVIEQALHICDWLQHEIIFAKPCESLRQRLRVTLGEEGLSDMYVGSLRISGGEEEGAGNQPMTVKIPSIYQADVLMFYSNFIRPFIQTMYIVIERLTKELKPCREIEFIRDLIKQTLSKSASEFPFDLMVEAVNSDSIKNCLRTLRDREIVTNESEPLRVLEPESLRDALHFAQLLTVHLRSDSDESEVI
ncbi:unnamed protein product, partial [Mesorhabditis belari]|uniref:Phospholipid/glycerol acyltransferase domain-containing protein n=1 Tax=Mesorhabditis belari TaxID=2138241 RepID=A0AAF3FIS2_9BILA